MKRITTLLLLVVAFALNAAAQATQTTFADHFDLSKYYTISTPVRGGFAVNSTSLISTNVERGVTDQQEGTENAEVVPSDENDPYQAFQFVPDPNDDSKVYLYTPAFGKYIDKNGNLQSKMENADPIYLFLLENEYPDYPYGLSFNDGSFSLVPQINNYYTIVINGWGNPDGGNSLKIAESNFKIDDALETQRENAREQVNSFALLTNLFTEEDIDNALDIVDAATTETELSQVVVNLKKALSGKDITLYSNFTTGENSVEDGVRPAGYLNDNGTILINDSLSFSSDFQLLYNDSLDAWALKNVFTGNYLQRIPQSTHATLSTTPQYTFQFLIKGNNLVAIGGPAKMEYIHNGFKGTGIVGWSDDAGDSQWVINAFNGAEALTGSLATVDAKVGTKWGDYKDTEAFEALKAAFVANPTTDTYKALLNSPDLVGSDGYVNIINTSENGQGNSISIIDKEQPGNFNMINGLGTDNEDPAQLWIVTSVKPGYVRLYSPNAQKYIGGNEGGSSASCIHLSTEPHDWQITWRNDSTFVLSDNGGNMNFETGGETNPENFGNLNQFAGSDTWVAHAINTLPLAASKYGDKKYGTVCYPFSITLPEGVKAYDAKVSDDGKTIDLIALEGNTIAAGQPAVIVTDNTTDEIVATISGTENSAINHVDGRLDGSYLPKNINNTDSILALGQNENIVGFYHLNRVINNGAYFPVADASVEGYALSGTVVTGINKIENSSVISADAPRYNLAGQRVGKDYKGVVIVNGKKFIQK